MCDRFQVTLEEQMICGALQTLNEEALEDVLLGEPTVPPGETPQPLPTISEHAPTTDPTPNSLQQFFTQPTDQNDECTSASRLISNEIDQIDIHHKDSNVMFDSKRQQSKVMFEDDKNLEPRVIVISGQSKHCDQTVINIPDNDSDERL